MPGTAPGTGAMFSHAHCPKREGASGWEQGCHVSSWVTTPRTKPKCSVWGSCYDRVFNLSSVTPGRLLGPLLFADTQFKPLANGRCLWCRGGGGILAQW